MADIVTTKFYDSEVAKADDFNDTADSPVSVLNSILRGAFEDVSNSFVVSGLSVRQLDTPSMNVEIAPGLAFDRATDKLIHLASAISVPVQASHASLDRLDTLEVRYLETDFDPSTRAFKDPVNGTVSYASVNTKTKVSLEGRCLAGSPGAGVAPAVESGWVKLAEVVVPGASGAIFDANIRNLTAALDQTDNSAWTADKQKTFSLGSIESIKDAILAHAAQIATQANTVHGIRQGSSNGFDADLLDGKHAAAASTADTIMLRDASGRAKVSAPAASDDVARKDTVDTHASATGSSAHGAVSAPTASQLMARDASGRAQVAAPAVAADIARKDTVDTHAGLSGASAHGAVSAPTANQLMARDASGRSQVAAPSAADDIARKADIDAEATLARNADNLTSGSVHLDRIPATLTGRDADTVDGLHASSFMAVTYTSQTINKTNSLNTNIAAMAVGEYKTVTKTGTGNGPISTPSGNMFVYRNSLGGSGVVGGGVSVWADAATGSVLVMRLA